MLETAVHSRCVGKDDISNSGIFICERGEEIEDWEILNKLGTKRI